jgi:GTP-binding protein Era
MTTTENAATGETHCGRIAIIGRPNVGKSTLINRVVGQKIAITSRRPQTTRHRVLGITNLDQTQLVFSDTPGWQPRPRTAMDKLMNRQIDLALTDMDAVLMVVDARAWREEDEPVVEWLLSSTCPRFLALNKIDRIQDPRDLLPILEKLAERLPDVELIPISALKGRGLSDLLRSLVRVMPVGEHLYPDDQVTDQSERALAAELLREQLMRQLGEELPYAAHVAITHFEDRPNVTYIEAEIWVEKAGQKAIVIGKQGSRLKELGTAARAALEQMLGRPVFLQTHVRQRDSWTQDPFALSQIELGNG